MTREGVFSYVKKTYRTEPDYPFREDFSSAVLRHKDTGKWFALIMHVTADKLGYESAEILDILTMKSEPVLIDSLVLRTGFHRAYHMNKTKWFSVELNDTVSEKELRSLIDLSYELTDKKNGSRMMNHKRTGCKAAGKNTLKNKKDKTEGKEPCVL